jgi:hypothetical protein
MLRAITRHLRRGKRGISTVIVVMLSLVLVVIIVGNVVLWSYQMNQLDIDRMQENFSLTNVTRTINGTSMSIKNSSPLSIHIIAVWIINSTVHQRYSADLFLNSGESTDYIRADISLPQDTFIAKIITERGNAAVFSSD